MSNFTIYHDLIIHAPLDEVFESVTRPEHLVNWWPLRCTGAVEKGAEYNFYFTAEYDWFGEVTECILNEAFYIKMTKADADWNTTSFGFDLEELEGGTQLHFWHKDWPECNAHFKIASFCWAMLLNGLKNYVEEGIVIPFEERQ